MKTRLFLLGVLLPMSIGLTPTMLLGQGSGIGVSCFWCAMSSCQESGTDAGWEGCRTQPRTFYRPLNSPDPRCFTTPACETFGDSCLEPGSGGPTYSIAFPAEKRNAVQDRIGERILLPTHVLIEALVQKEEIEPALAMVLLNGLRIGPTQGTLAPIEVADARGVVLETASYWYDTLTVPVGAGEWKMIVRLGALTRKGRIEAGAREYELWFELGEDPSVRVLTGEGRELLLRGGERSAG